MTTPQRTDKTATEHTPGEPSLGAWPGTRRTTDQERATFFSQVLDGEPALWGYIQAKATRYIEVGPDVYREGDYYHMPSADWPPELLGKVESGIRQIVTGHGLKKDDPLVDVGIDGFYALMGLLHFEVSKQSAQFNGASVILDQMQMKHVMHGGEIVLYNLVPAPVIRRRAPKAKASARRLDHGSELAAP